MIVIRNTSLQWLARANDYVKVDWKDDQCRVWIITDKEK